MPRMTPGLHAMDDDDLPVGRLLSRRETLGLFAGATFALLLGCTTDDDGDDATPDATPTSTGTSSTATSEATTAAKAATAAGTTEATASATTSTGLVADCVAVPDMTEGPYFVDTGLNRSDIRADSSGSVTKEGAPLSLTVNVGQVASNTCAPFAGAIVDIWHCDAEGMYSGVVDRGQGFDTTEEDWLRGQQVTDAAGSVTFQTIYPGWYPGRSVHIHFKIRTANGYEFTSQFFFDETLSGEVLAEAPYPGGEGRTLNSQDGIYRSGGDQLELVVTPTTFPDGVDGYASTFTVGLQI